MCGCYNSGTTIIREMLGAHPDISSMPREGVVLTNAFPDLEKNGWQRMWHRNADSANLPLAKAKTIAKTAISDWQPWWNSETRVNLEKSIIHAAWMETLQCGFKNPKFIGVIRNGYCSCEGIRRRAKPSGLAKEILGTSEYSWGEVGKQWVFANDRLLNQSNRVDHYLEIRYEDLVEAPASTIRNVFLFLGVDPSLVVENDDMSITIGSRNFQISNKNRESMDRLDSAARQELNEVIEPMLTKLGYETID